MPQAQIQDRSAAAELIRRKLARSNFNSFVKYTFRKYSENWHHRRITEKLQGVIEGSIKRLMIRMPPRHGKSEMVSRRLPAAFLGAHPDAKVIHASYSASLASKENRQVQRIMMAPEYRALFPNVRIPAKDNNNSDRRYVRNNHQFEIIGTGGQYICAGIGGPITGEGMTLGILDDPIKNAEEADSETFRDNFWDWYISTFLTRDEGDAALVICGTDWHEDGPFGRIQAHAKENGEKWEILDLEALRENTTDEDDPRKEGDALWPAKFNKTKLELFKKTLGDRWFNAMYQQRPSATEGNILRRELWHEYDETEPQKYVATVESLDTAHDKNSTNDYSVNTKWGITSDGQYADLLDLWMERVEFPELKTQTIAICDRDVPSHVLIERKGSGISLIQELKRNTRIPVWGPPPDKPGGKEKPLGVVPDRDKVARANAASGFIASGRIRIPKRAPWKETMLTQCANFPNATHDDIVDSITQFINWFRLYWVRPAQIISNPVSRYSRYNRL